MEWHAKTMDDVAAQLDREAKRACETALRQTTIREVRFYEGRCQAFKEAAQFLRDVKFA